MTSNLLTGLRLVLAAPIALLIQYAGDSPSACRVALGLFLLAGVTDALDGWAARRFGKPTSFGTFFDPVADKVFSNVLMVYLAWRMPGWMNPWAVLLILAREFIVQGFRSVAPARGVLLTTGTLNKFKFGCLYVTIGLVLAGLCVPSAAGPLRTATWVALAVSLAVAYLSMILLFRQNRDLWRRPDLPMEKR